MIRVYEIPEKVQPVGYLFSGGKPIEFLMVDWFGEPDDLYGEGPIPGRPELEQFLRVKRYRNPGRRYLVVSDDHTDLTFVLEPGEGEKI